MSKIIVAGTRTFTKYNTLEKVLDYCIKEHETVNPQDTIHEIVSGHARGVDKLGEEYARVRKYGIKIFHADWNTYQKAAGPIRNAKMAEYGDILVAFWDMRSKGTLNMIQQMNNLDKPVLMYNFVTDTLNRL
jgi:hypothetical protein